MRNNIILLRHLGFLLLLALWLPYSVHGAATFAETALIYNDAATTVQWADFDQDGDLDLVVAEGGRHSGGSSKRMFAWFEAPSWTRHDIEQSGANGLGAFTGATSISDVDGDGYPDVVIAVDQHSSLSTPRAVYWYKNPFASETNLDTLWQQNIIESPVPNAFHIGDMDIGDMDGDGMEDVIVRHLRNNSFVVYFKNSPTSWTPRRFAARHREGLVVGDIDQDGRDDIIGNGFILFSPTVGSDPRTDAWTEVEFDPAYFTAPTSGLNNSIKAAVADMDGDNKDDIIMSSAEGNQVYLAWFKTPSNPRVESSWLNNGVPTQRNYIENPQGRNHQVQIADIDLDGDPDVYGGFSFGSSGVHWWENTNGLATAWSRQTIDTNQGCYYCVAADFDNDGDVDFAGPTSYVGRVYLYENTTADNSGALILTPNTLNFDNAANSSLINVTSDESWTASDNQPWINVSPLSGNQNATITISVTAHNGIGDRTGVINVTNGTITRTVTVTQTGQDDTVPPSQPSNAAVSNVIHNAATLNWTTSTDNSGSITRYNIYVNGVQIDTTPSPPFNLIGLTPETNYVAGISAVDAANNESAIALTNQFTTLPQPASPPPVGYWRLDESAPSTTAVDQSGFHPGTLLNMSGNEWTNGILSGAVLLDGVDDAISLGTIDIVDDNGNDANQMSLIVWINPTTGQLSSHPEGRIISKASGSNGNDHFWMLSTIASGNKFVPRFRLKTGSSTTTLVASAGEIEENQWSQLAAVYDGSNMLVYQDGVLVGSTAKSGTVTRNANVAVSIGNQPAGDARPFAGLIDDVCILNQALDAQAVSDLYNNGSGLTCNSDNSNNQDTIAPVLAEITPITTPDTETTPGYTFSSTESGTAIFGGDCSATPSTAVAEGETSISFAPLSPGTHNNCTVTVTDNAGNASQPLLVSAFTIIETDTTPPSVTLNQAASQTDPTNINTALFAVQFSEPIQSSSFTAGDILLSGTSGEVAAGPTPVAGNETTQFTFTVSNMQSGDNVVATLPAGSVLDLDGNDNTASTSQDNLVSFDNIKPGVMVEQAPGQIDPTPVNQITFHIFFDEAILPNTLTAADIEISESSGTILNGPVLLSGASNIFEFSISGLINGETVAVSLPSDRVSDLAGNLNTASTSVDNSVTYDCDDSCPDLDIDQDGVDDGVDNCLNLPNPDQADTNQNGIGDVCEVEAEDLCFPIKSAQGKTSLICL